MTEIAGSERDARVQELRRARAAVAKQRETLDAVGTPGQFGEGALNKELALLQTASMHELSVAMEKSAGDVEEAVGQKLDQAFERVQALTTAANLVAAQVDTAALNVSKTVDHFERTLKVEIGKLTTSSETTGNRIADWTKWLAFGTFALALTTLLLVIVEAFKR
jgi:hypothetical protein